MPTEAERTKMLWEAGGGAQQETESGKSERQKADEESEDGVLQKRRQEEIRRKEEKEDEQRKEGQELKGSPEIPDLPGEDPKDWTYRDTSRHVPGGTWLSQTPTLPPLPFSSKSQYYYKNPVPEYASVVVSSLAQGIPPTGPPCSNT
ncbi:hypothetical protein NDU88_006487 [Pleurodeles waltl]|uniref:Uncharacterized protein n=1 Tax=Pleurodeles waltl TaxID=8319 RepID=A0AAV7TWZ8_PLEWA|nr:hypothetical protein NDU88_006487 [Pleurodeles waltl]